MGRLDIDPRRLEVQSDSGASLDAVGAEDPAQLRQQRVEARVHCGRVGFAPKRLGELVAGYRPVPVENEVDEEQSALAAGKFGIDPLAATVYDKRATDIDPKHG